MKKIIIFCALIITAIVCYTLGYCFFSFDNPSINLKEQNYILQKDSTIESTNNCEERYFLYPVYGEILIFNYDGSFFNRTGIYLNELSREKQIELLQNNESFNLTDLYNYLDEFSTQSNLRLR